MAMASSCSVSGEGRDSSPILSQAGSDKGDVPILGGDDMQTAFSTQVPQYKLSVDSTDRHVQSIDRNPKHKSSVVDLHAQLILLLGTKNKEKCQTRLSGSELSGTVIRQQLKQININNEPEGANIYHHSSLNSSGGINQEKSNAPQKTLPKSLNEDDTRPHAGLSVELPQNLPALKGTRHTNTSQQELGYRGGSKTFLGAKPSPPPPAGVSCPIIQKFENERPFGKGINHIPLSVVRIPSGQKALLDSGDFWLDPSSEEGKFCVPQDIMDALDAFYGHKLSSERVTQDVFPTKDSVKDAAEEAETDSENQGGDQISHPHRADGSSSVIYQSSPCQSEGHLGVESVSCVSSPMRELGPLTGRPDSSSAMLSESTIQRNSFSLSEREPRQPPQKGAVVSIHSPERTIRNSSPCPSSSQVEMDLVVPDALDDQVSPSENRIGASSVNQCTPSMTHQSQRTVQVKLTPVAIPKRVGPSSPQNFASPGTRLPTDIFIPGTFENTVANSPNLASSIKTVRLLDCPRQSSLGEIEADSFISLESHPIVEENGDTARQLHGELRPYLQRAPSIESISSGLSLSDQDNLGGENRRRQHRYNGTNSSPEVAAGVVNSVSPPPACIFKQSRRPNASPGSPDWESLPSQTSPDFPSPRAGQLKRVVSPHEPAAKRRRLNLTEASWAHDTITDPREMARANRKNFLQAHNGVAAVEQGSQLSAPHSSDVSSIGRRQPDVEIAQARTSSNHCCELPPDTSQPSPPQLPITRGAPGGATAATAVPPLHSPHMPEAPSTASDRTPTATRAFDAPNVFERFKRAYPSFKASQKSFICACAYIEWLKAGQKLHPTLWDDFIRAFAEDYGGYVKYCMRAKQDPVTGLQFYNEYVPEPLFSCRLITASTLSEGLLLDPVLTARCRKAFENRVQREEDLSSVAPTSPISADEIMVGSQDVGQALAQFPRRTEHVSKTTGTSVDSIIAETPGANSRKFSGRVAKSQDQELNKGPFYETPSRKMLTISPQRNLAESAEKAGVSGEGGDKSRNVETLQVRESTSAHRQLPWSLYPGITSRHEGQLGLDEDVSDVMKSAKSSLNLVGLRRTGQDHNLVVRRGSPILGTQTPAPKIGVTTASVTLPNLTPSQTHPMLETRPFASKTLEHKPKSMSGPIQAKIARVAAWRYSQMPSSLPAKKLGYSSRPMPRLSFDQLVKTYVPRRRRMSGASSLALTPTTTSPNIILRKTVDDDHFRSTEPETQAWNDQ